MRGLGDLIDIYVMDDEYCCNCGTALNIRFETTLCTDCLHDAWYTEDQDFYEGWELACEDSGT